VVESKPDNSLDDLRITDPWPELAAYCSSIALDSLTHAQHGHVPYIVILYQVLQEWKAQHDGRGPQNYKEKEAFKAAVMAKRWSDEEANFGEAATEAKNAWIEPEIPESVQALFQSTKCTQENASEFWVCVLALRQFAEKHKCLPLSGSLPDMNSDTQSYQAIQSLYREKAQRDMEEVTQYVNDVLRLSGGSARALSEEYIRLVCKNAHYLCAVETRSLAQEMEGCAENGERINEAIDMDMHGTPKWSLCLRAYDRFITNYNRAPGSSAAELESDFKALKTFAHAICEELHVMPALVADEPLQELCRFGGGEIHTVSAALGGIAAQEVIKLITHQLVPLNNTLILDTINCTSAMFEA